MVSDWHPLVVRQQRIIGTKKRSNVGGVMNRCVEISVIADLNRQYHFDILLRTQTRCSFGTIRRVFAEQFKERAPQRRQRAGPRPMSEFRDDSLHAS